MVVTPTLNFAGECEDAIRLYEKAFDTKEEVERAFAVLADGGEALVPLRRTTYSSCVGNVIDRFGVRWGLLTEQTER